MTEPSELERVARAIYAADWPEPHHNSFNECPPDMRERYINLAQAALSAMPDPSGDVVKFLSDPIFGFLLGENDLNGFWWGDIPPAVQKGKMGQYWWRTNLRHALCRFSALSAVPDPQGNNGQLAANIMARLRGHGIINEDFCAERQDEFEAYILTPMLTDPLALPTDVYDFVSKAGLLATNHGGWFDKHGFAAISPMCDWANRILEKYERAAIDPATLEVNRD